MAAEPSRKRAASEPAGVMQLVMFMYSSEESYGRFVVLAKIPRHEWQAYTETDGVHEEQGTPVPVLAMLERAAASAKATEWMTEGQDKFPTVIRVIRCIYQWDDCGPPGHGPPETLKQLEAAGVIEPAPVFHCCTWG